MKNWIKTVLYSPKHSKVTDKNILRLLLPSLVGIIFCMICLAGSTWAWFSASIQTQPQTIKAAKYDIEVSVTNETGASVLPGQPLEAGQAYKITLTASGTADNFGGYCIVEGGEKPLYTTPLLPGHTLSFTLIPTTTADYVFTAAWGSHSGTVDITDGCTSGQKAETQPDPQEPASQQTGENVHLVQSGDSLWKIAKQYDATVEKIAAYNGIDRNAVLQIGQEIKIPPANYEIPEEPVSTSPQQAESQQKADEPAPTEPESTVSEPVPTAVISTQNSDSSIPAEMSDSGKDNVISE